jgi:Kef-type K+ transport systems, predicted NAD-binding component
MFLGGEKCLKKISTLKDHFIVCGIGDIGRIVVKELIQTKRDFVVIDADSEQLAKLSAMETVLFINNDATNDEVLINAGIYKAQGLITILPEDKDNLFVTLTARQLNPNLRIVAKGLDELAIKKLKWQVLIL